jgi:hypothetical protein
MAEVAILLQTVRRLVFLGMLAGTCHFDAQKYNWGEWEASKVGTAAALDLIPKDIILCL